MNEVVVASMGTFALKCHSAGKQLTGVILLLAVAGCCSRKEGERNGI